MLLWTSLLGDGAFGAPGDPAPEWESTITIASGEVSVRL